MGHLGYFRPNYQHPFWYSESLVHVFQKSTIISTKTKPLYPHPKYFFGIGISICAAKNQGFSLRVSVVLAFWNIAVAVQHYYCKFPFSSGSMQYIVCNSMQQDYSFCLIGFMRVGDVICDPISSLHSIQQQTKSGFPFGFLKDFQSDLLLIFAI